MPSVDNTITIAGVKVKGVPEYACLTSMGDWLKLLEQHLQVEIPGSVSNVVVSNQQPAENERNKVWFRVDNSGSFVGIYVYSLGKWRKIIPVDGQVSWIKGDSRAVPDGYLLVDADNPNFTAAEANVLKSQYILEPLAGAFYTYFAVTFEGF